VKHAYNEFLGTLEISSYIQTSLYRYNEISLYTHVYNVFHYIVDVHKKTYDKREHVLLAERNQNSKQFIICAVKYHLYKMDSRNQLHM
jgi:hypothetical protein